MSFIYQFYYDAFEVFYVILFFKTSNGTEMVNESEVSLIIKTFFPNSTDEPGFQHPSWAMKKRATGCLGYIGDYTTQLYGDYNKPL